MLNVSGRERLKLSGFNNLTKALSFNMYDFCIAMDEDEREAYIQFIDEKYNAREIQRISEEVCKIIEAEILSVSLQDYDPVGASSMVLMSDVQGGKWDRPMKQGVSFHLDKSHITAHTYPDASDQQGICSFRVDIDIATCGEIIPLKAVNYLFHAFECDVVFIDYVVRGFTRTESGEKIYNDFYFNSIQDFIERPVLENYLYRSDLNMAQENIWQTKLMIKEFGPERYLMAPKNKDLKGPEVAEKMKLLKAEMREVFHLS